MAYHIDGHGWAFEGSQVIEDDPFVLVENQVGEELKNRYHAVLCAEFIIDADLKKEPHVRNRQFQVLTELRPVFNPQFIREMKKAMMAKHVGGITFLETLVESQYFPDITSQFLMDTSASALTEWGDVKRFCYRLLNVLSLRVGLAGRMRFSAASSLQTDEEWDELFDWLAWPGVVKLVNLSNLIRDSLPSEKKALDLLDNVIQKYYEILWRFTEGVSDPAAMRDLCRQIVHQFGGFLAHLRGGKSFKAVSSRYAWLFSTADIAERVNKW